MGAVGVCVSPFGSTWQAVCPCSRNAEVRQACSLAPVGFDVKKKDT